MNKHLRSMVKNTLITLRIAQFSSKPTASEVLTAYLMQCNEPPWTSYFVKYRSVKDDQFGMSNFNWKVGSSNYQILRTGCFPYIKYHCSKRIAEDLKASDKFMRAIKVVNLGCHQVPYQARKTSSDHLGRDVFYLWGLGNTMVYKWHNLFKQDRNSIEDDPRLGRPVEVTAENVDKLEKIIPKNARLKKKQLTEMIEVSAATVATAILSVLQAVILIFEISMKTNLDNAKK